MTILDLNIFLRTYLICFGLQLLGWPWVKRIFKKLPDKGWCLGRVFSSLTAALVIWELSNLGMPANTSASVYAFLALMGLSAVWLVAKEGREAFLIPRNERKLIAMEEYLFFIGLGAMTLIRGFAPNIDSLEKFMDFGFVNQYLASPILPAKDMWQAGQAINYYSFGHFWTSILIRIWAVDPAVGYNLMLAFIFGTAMMITFMTSYVLVGKNYSRQATLGGIIGALSVLVAGNSHPIWYLLKNHSMDSYWYADATRFIYNTIHEFPSYSFVVSDLHGHLIDLPIVLTFLLVMIAWIKNRERILEVVMGILFGVMMMTNTWDVAVYGLVLTVLAIQLVISDFRDIKKIITTAGVMFVAATIVAIPWWLSFKSISNGIGMVSSRTPLWQLAVLWGGGLIISLIVVITEGNEKNKLPIRTLALTALLLIVIPELIYAKDIYPNHPRANTMFKLTYQAFIMMGILAGAGWGKLVDRENKKPLWWRFPAFVLIFWIFAGEMIFPFEGFASFYGNFENYQGLNGEKWMAKRLPENYGVVQYLRTHKDGTNLLEAVGDSYTLLNAVSVFSGVPSVQGWRVHEWLWRGGYGPVAEREAEVREAYQDNNLTKTKATLKKYHVGWILIGPDERITYKVNEEKLWQLGELVWNEGDAYLLRVNRNFIGRQ